jgi:septum formation protein
MLFKNKLNLASGSPRRRELIGYLFENIEFLKTDCDEPVWKKPQKPEAYLDLCVDTKWRAAQEAFVSRSRSKGEYLLVADTIVVMGSDVLGKPLHKKNAMEMLRRLSNSQHEVWTSFRIGKWSGVDFVIENRKVVSQVRFRKMSPKEILSYVESGEPMDKAGAYGFQGIGIQNIREVRGSYTSIVGLPLLELREATLRLDERFAKVV